MPVSRPALVDRVRGHELAAWARISDRFSRDGGIDKLQHASEGRGAHDHPADNGGLRCAALGNCRTPGRYEPQPSVSSATGAAPDGRFLQGRHRSLQDRPRAFEYFNFFASLTPDSSGVWRRVDKLEDAGRGDIMAWRFPTIERGEDTGHVVILAESPTRDPSGKFLVVRLYDSAAVAHFDDTRMPQGQPSPTGTTGVGSGLINMLVDGEGRPILLVWTR